MDIKKKFLAAIMLSAATAGVNAQDFKPLDPKYYPDPYDLVDTLFFRNEKKATFPQAGDIYYLQALDGPAVEAGFNDGFGAKWVEKTINGKKWEYIPYSFPALCYIASKLPNNGGDFYGFYTTGFEKSEEMLKGAPQENPYSRFGLIYGTIVHPDGERETFIRRPESEWKKLSVSKPSGTFYVHDYSDKYQNLDITFNAGGTGRIVYHLPRTEHQAPQEIAGMSTQRRANGTVKKHHRSFTGGYWFYMNATITSPIKWTYTDGTLTITPTGKATTAVSGGINYERTWARQSITESDKQIENGKHRADFPNNEYVVAAKKSTKERVDDYAASLEQLEFPVVHMTQKEILVGTDSENFPGKFYYIINRSKTYDNIMDYGLESIDRLFQRFSAKRVPPSTKLYNHFVTNAKIGISMAQAPLAEALYYVVDDINPMDRSAKIGFVTPGHLYAATLKFDAKWHVDNSVLQSSLTEDNTIADNRARIAANNERIAEYKKDKRRAKIVKNYEKRVKDMTPAETFSTLEQFRALLGQQKRLLEIQEETLKSLE